MVSTFELEGPIALPSYLARFTAELETADLSRDGRGLVSESRRGVNGRRYVG